MFWNILLYLYLGSVVISFFAFVGSTFSIAGEVKRKHPELKIPKGSLLDGIITWMRVIWIAALPVFNILYATYIMLCFEEVKEAVIAKLEQKFDIFADKT